MRCSYCGEQGHNRVYCEKRKARVEREREKFNAQLRERGISVLEDGSYSVPQGAHLPPEHWIVTQDNKYARSRKKNKCSYCFGRYGYHSHDHNRRNCPKKKIDMEKAQLLNKRWKIDLVEALKYHGIGPGTVLLLNVWGFSKPQHYTISRIHWEDLNLLRSFSTFDEHGYGSHANFPFELEPLLGLTKKRGAKVLPVISFNQNCRRSKWRKWNVEDFEILFRSPPRLIDASIPEGWLESNAGLEVAMNKCFDKKAYSFVRSINAGKVI
tara:strand:+ start:8553 stop:9356 length:804 start_codon:yes stop_codon:yes gene_type:complete